MAAQEQLFTVHEGDARRLGSLLAAVSSPAAPLLTCTITSPPYGNLKNYGHPDQIGWGQPYDEYLVELRRIFRTIYQHTRPEGSMWLIADTLRLDDSRSAVGRMEPLPFQLASEAADAGWVLRETVIWQKDKTLPWSSGGRLRNAFEYVLLFVKSPSYKFRVDRLRDPTEVTQWWVRWPERYNPHGPVPTNIWDIPIPVQGSWKTPAVQHACPLPPDLVERLVFLATDPGDVVLDPFAGTGVVVAEAERLGRRAIGVEINRKYVKAYSKHMRPEIAKRNSTDRLAKNAAEAAARRNALIKLRALKYPKVIMQQLSNAHGDVPQPEVAAAIVHPFDERALVDPIRPLKVQLVIGAQGSESELEDLLRAIKEVEGQAPLSKFGVQSQITIVHIDQFTDAIAPRKRLFLYTAGRTWTTSGRVDVRDVARLIQKGEHIVRGDNYRYAPVLSNLEVRETG